jgi:hypothetical protein
LPAATKAAKKYRCLKTGKNSNAIKHLYAFARSAGSRKYPMRQICLEALKIDVWQKSYS